MRILFVGFIPPASLQDKVKEWGAQPDLAGYAFQSALISGLDRVCDELKIITTLWVPPYPKAKKIFIPKERFSHTGSDENRDTFIGFINLPVIKRISVSWRYFKEIWRVSREDKDMVLINYALSSSSLIPISLLHNRFKKVCQIVPDLPEFMSPTNKFFYRIGKSIDIRLINRCLKKVDSFVLLSPYMKEKLPVGSKPWMHLEGIYDLGDNVFVTKAAIRSKKVVMYSGMLALRYGIGDLVKAFRKIEDEDYELWLCGYGSAQQLIIRNSQEDKRIKYFGVLDRKEVLAKQRQATVLVNPRHRTEEYTKYSFPSKTMEFMASGTPVIMSHLDSIPSDYDAHIYYFDDESVEGIRCKIEDVCEKPVEELREFGRRASEFILSQKNSLIQAERLCSFITDY